MGLGNWLFLDEEAGKGGWAVTLETQEASSWVEPAGMGESGKLPPIPLNNFQRPGTAHPHRLGSGSREGLVTSFSAEQMVHGDTQFTGTQSTNRQNSPEDPHLVCFHFCIEAGMIEEI